MSKIMFIAKRFVIGMVLVLSFCTASFAAVHNSNFSSRITKGQLQERLNKISSDIPMRYTDEVHQLVNIYIRVYRRGSERLLGKSNVFFPIFDLEMANYTDLPNEIKYLSIIESSLDVHAVSKSGAVGLWQFMAGTAKLHGLSINRAVDERKDAYLSTKAAFKYLEYLYSQFDDWTLALAAYNCGPGNVKKAIRRSQSTNFWKLQAYLPKETRRYIPKFIATSYLMSYYTNHNLKPDLEAPKFERTAIARIHDYTTFNDISRVTGLSLREIKDLNPAFKGGYLPRSDRGYLLTLPEREMFHYLANKGLMNNLEFTLANPMKSFERTIIYTGFQTRKAELESLNRMPALVSLVKNPFIKNVETKVELATLAKAETENEESEKFDYYILQIGESIKELVGRHSNGTMEELLRLNQIDLNNPPKPGDRIKIKK